MENALPPLPPIDPALVKALNQRFPHRCPNPNDSEREIWMKAGERRLVDFLLMQQAKQEKEALKGKILS